MQGKQSLSYSSDLPSAEYVEVSKEADLFFEKLPKEIRKKFSPRLQKISEKRLLIEERVFSNIDQIETYQTKIRGLRGEKTTLYFPYAFLSLTTLAIILISQNILLAVIFGGATLAIYKHGKPRREEKDEEITDYQNKILFIKKQIIVDKAEIQRCDERGKTIEKTIRREIKKEKDSFLEKEIDHLKNADRTRFCNKCGGIMFDVGHSEGIDGYHMLKCKNCDTTKEFILE